MQLYLTWFSLASAMLALCLSLISLRQSSIRLGNSKLSRTITGLNIELAEIQAVVGSLASQLKKQNARMNMRRAREKNKDQKNGEMTDAEWRAYATKQAQLRQPIE